MTTESSHERASTQQQQQQQPNDRSFLQSSLVEGQQDDALSATTDNNGNSSSHIRHSGRVLVRGKIRRVWRPRFLEVWGNGLVRYYEVAPPPGQNHSTLDAFVDPNALFSSSSTAAADSMGDLELDEDDQYHSKSPKCTLWIHHARIIDVTTLRDMHVGLPRGAFGFLFHGHRMDQDDDYYGSSSAGGDLQDFASMLLSGSSSSRDTTTTVTSMGGLACQGNTNLTQPRDFLCAVPSLEEAQSWVIALQWAASVGRENAYHASGFLSPGNNNNNNNNYYNDDSHHSWEQHPENDLLSVASSSANQSQLPAPSSPTRSSTSTPKRKSPGKRKQQTPPKQPPEKTTSAGKMVVTKVIGYTLARVDTWQWDVAYQIRVLLVIPSQKQVQEWSITRTAKDLKHLVDKLSLHSTKLYKQSELVSNLPQIQSSVQQHTTQKKNTDFTKAISNVDTLLRSLCMEATLVNSSCMKRFLAVRHPRPKIQSRSQLDSYWKIHDPTSISSTPKRIELTEDDKKRGQQGSKGTDQFVKQWLQQHHERLHTHMQSTTSTTMFQLLFWYLRLPQPSTTYACLILVSSWFSATVLPVLNRLITKYNLIPSVSIRLDALLFSWAVAAGIGHFVVPLVVRGETPVLSRQRASAASGGTPTRQNYSKMKEDDTIVQSASTVTSPGKREGTEEDVVINAESDDEEDVDGDEYDEDEEDALEATTGMSFQKQDSQLSSPLPEYNPDEGITTSCWSKPKDDIFHVRGPNYLKDRVKMPSKPASFTCEGVDMWMTDNPERHIARHSSVLGGKLAETNKDMLICNFLLPFGNFCSYFSIPPLEEFSSPQLADVWTGFIQGDQQYRDARLKLLPVVVDGPWIVKAAVGPGTAPALLGKAIPLQYFFTENHPISEDGKENKKGGKNIYEVDVIITASSIAKGILSVVKGHTKALSIAFAFIIEAAEQKELPESVLCSFQVNSLNIDECPHLPDCNLDN